MSITEVKSQIAMANQQARDGAATLDQSTAKLDQAIGLLNKAAEGTEHDLIKQARSALAKAKASIGAAKKAIAQSQESSNRYAKSI